MALSFVFFPGRTGGGARPAYTGCLNFDNCFQKESILGVFDLGFKERGFNVDMDQLRLLLSHPDSR